VSCDDDAEGDPIEHRDRDSFSPGWIDYIVRTYGPRRFLADLDEGRTYTEAGLVAACLRYVSREGFAEFAERNEIPFHSARHFRERLILEALRGPMP
jgi:hypothetical protein